MWTIRHVRGHRLVRPARMLRILASAVVLSLVFAAVSPAVVQGPLRRTFVAAAGDPVIAAAGDLACDPPTSSFNGAHRSSSSSPPRSPSRLLANRNFPATLSLCAHH